MITSFTNFINNKSIKKELGFKQLEVAKFVLSILHVNNSIHELRQFHTKSSDIFLQQGETILKFKTIALKIDCSISTVEKTIKKLIEYKIIARSKIKGIGIWVMSVIHFKKDSWKDFWNSFRMIKTKRRKIFFSDLKVSNANPTSEKNKNNIINNTQEDIKPLKINWDWD